MRLSFKAYEAEIARRARARKMAELETDFDRVRAECKTFSGFVRHAWEIIEPGTRLRWNWHMEAMCLHLEAISRGTLHPRLIINVPPGSSKSTLVSVLWQAWEWGPFGKPHVRFVSTSFELGNVKRDTMKTRDLIESEWYQRLWPETALKTSGVQQFSNFHTGSRTGVAFKSVTGKRGDRLLVDDPHSLDGAESETQREGAVRSFIEGGLNRINDWETSAIVIVMQRLHESDLTGELLAKDFGFIHLMIPMEFEPARRCTTPLQVPDPENPGEKIDWTDPRSYEGELMDPGRVPEEAVALLKKIGEYAYNGQYLQRPAPREGGMFKVEFIDVVDHCPSGGITVAGWDFAGSKRKKSPYTVRVLMTRIGGDIYIRDVVREQTNPTELNKLVVETSADDRKRVPSVLISIPQDPGQAGKAQKWAMADQLIGYKFRATPETGDKETRAEPFAAMVGAERVHMVKGKWNSAYKEELRNFPGGTFKDQVDASSRAFSELVSATPVPVNAGPELVDASEMDLDDDDGNDDPWGARDYESD